MSEKMLEIGQVANRLKLSFSTLYRHIELNNLRAINVSTGDKRKHYRIKESDYEEFCRFLARR